MDEELGEEAGEEPEKKLKARDPSFFATPWEPPEHDPSRDDRPTVLTVATKEQLTPLQRVFIRVDATVRINRIWKGRYDRFNGHYFIEALKDAPVHPVPKVEEGPDFLAMGEGEGEMGRGMKGEGEEEEEEEEEEEKEVHDVEIEGEEAPRDVIQIILGALKFVQEKHDEAWKKQEVAKLCKEYKRKANEIKETKRDWKMRCVKLQMEWADCWTDFALALQNEFVKIKEQVEDYEMMKALEAYETMQMEEEKNQELPELGEEEEIDESRIQLKPMPLTMENFLGTKQKLMDKKNETRLQQEIHMIEEELSAEFEGEFEEIMYAEEGTSNQTIVKTSSATKKKSPYTRLQFVPKTSESLKDAPKPPKRLDITMPIKTYVDTKGRTIREIPVFIQKPNHFPEKQDIEENLADALELYEESPDINPFECALWKSVHQAISYGPIKRNRAPKFARVGVYRIEGQKSTFVPNLRNFDHKTVEILRHGSKKEISKLPLSSMKVLTMSGTGCTLANQDGGFSEGHVTFRGAMNKFECKSLMRIFIEETMTPEEYRKRYKGRNWMKRKLSRLYEEFNEKKTEIINSGVEGRITSERREENKTCCPIFWSLAGYLRMLLGADTPKEYPITLDYISRFFHSVILEQRPELKHESERINQLLARWGGYEMCHIDLESIVNLMWILAEIEELKMCWEEIKNYVINATTCPLCLLFKYLKTNQRTSDEYPRMTSRKLTQKSTLAKELMSLEAIAEEFKNRERPARDPSMFPDEHIFHIVSTVDEKKKMNSFRLGQDRNSTRAFIMRSCATVIFDISRSEKEIPWVWRYLKQHMELLDKKDVRDEADQEPLRHLILVTNFLSWAKSPKQVKARISEATFHQRLPHPDYEHYYKLENTIHYIGVNHKQFKLRTTIIYTGITFGEEEDVLVYLFKMAWDNELELPLFGTGRNVLPLIHITDLTWVVVRTVNERTYPLMIFALNKNNQTLFAIATRIATTFGSTKVVKFPSPDFKMKFCIPKIIDDLLKQNVRYENIETPYQIRHVWNNAFFKQKKLLGVIKELRETRKLYGKTILLIGPPSKAKAELAIIISKLYNLPLIHKGNILNYFLRATQELEPPIGEGEGEDEEGAEEEEEEEGEKENEDEEEGEEKKKKFDPAAQEKRFFKLVKKMMDSKAANKERKQLTKLLQKLLQSVFIQSHGYVLVDWPVRKEDTIALFTKTLDDQQMDEEEEPKTPQPPPPRPEVVIHVAAPDQHLDDKNYFLFQDLFLKDIDEMEKDLREYRYYRQIHQSIVDLFEERNHPIYRLSNHDGFSVVGKLVCILGEPQQASGRWIYEMFLSNEKACDKKAVQRGKKMEAEARWLKRQYKRVINDMLAVGRERNYSLREQLLGKPLEIFKNTTRVSPNLRRSFYHGYKEWRNIDQPNTLKKRWTNEADVWGLIENRRWVATVEKAKEMWLS